MASVKVAVRVRPFTQREINLGSKCIIKMEGNRTIICDKIFNGRNVKSYKDFTFDYSYWSFDKNEIFTSQQKVFEDLGTDVVDAAFEGYNACVFAYGQTGSGKTYTMMGTPGDQGLIPRICESLFSHMLSDSSYRVEVSYMEIYNEKVRDLLNQEVEHILKIREHPLLGPIVKDLSKHLVSDYSHIQALISQGNAHRTTANTNMNDYSSRSHAIFTIMFVQAGLCNNLPTETVSKIHLVDLAGSERADSTGASGIRLKEGAHINKSLLTLGSVISALAELSSCTATTQQKPFIPYRDSILTWFLKDSLGGNSKTIMIAAISPADCSYNETLSTLYYANRAKKIVNKPKINEDPNVKLIRELRAEIKKLKDLMSSERPSIVVRETLFKKEAQEKVLTKRWAHKWKETQCILQEQEDLALRKAGSGIVLDSERPHLICIGDNLLSTGVTLYHLMDGETLIGTDAASQKQHIVLTGTEMVPEHCSIVLENGTATLIPKPNALCWVNGHLIEKPTVLFQGCMILVGRTNMFRYNDPVQAERMRRDGDISRSHLNLSQMSFVTWSSPDLNRCSDYNFTFETFFDNSSGSMKLRKISGSERLLVRKSMNTNEVDNISSLVCAQNHLENLKKEKNVLEELKLQMLEKNIEFTQYITEKMDSLTKNNNCESSKLPLPSNLILDSDLRDNVESINLTAELLTKKIGINYENCIKHTIMDDIRNHQLNMLALVDKEITIKDVAVSVNEIKVRALESELNQIVPFDSDPMNHKSIDPSEENMHVCSIEEDEISKSAASSASPSCSHQSLNLENSNIHSSCDDLSRQENDNTWLPNNQLEEKPISVEEVEKRENVLKELLNKISQLQINILRALDSGTNCDVHEQYDVLKLLKTKFLEMEAWFVNVQNRNKEVISTKEQEIPSPSEIDGFDVQLNPVLKSANQLPELPQPSNFADNHPINIQSGLGNNCATFSVFIPSFVRRGTGVNAHYAYEVVLQAGSDNWVIIRRYRRFRDLYLTVKKKYGNSVSHLYFPPKKLFFHCSVSLARERQQHLESYLQSLIAVCAQIPLCPLYGFHHAPSKDTLVEFSSFFIQGIFETGKFATS